MPYASVNGARIFYRRFGARSGAPPVLLIHGATVDGATDWGAMAPVVGLGHEVIVPDCRGHGRSDNPSGSYSFRELAADAAALVRALGHDRAHVVGHSNGGNVALVTLLEYPDAIASCVIQAGNAYVSPDLVEKEPANFEPDRVARDWPAWRDQMIELHSRRHGPDYWRTLLQITVAEIVSEPNYTEADLGRVDAPVLVIEGENDRVNAASGHGAFIARGIPDAELWRPAGVGHSVHEERPAEWLGRVEDFWGRRGTAARDVLWRARAASDARSAVLEYAISATDGAERADVTVDTPEHARVIDGQLAQTKVRRTLHVLSEAAAPAFVRAGVADVMRDPEPASDRLTQVLFGERVSILEERSRFGRVRLELDGYVGWIRPSALERHYPVTSTHRVWADEALALAEPGGEIVARLPFGASVSAAAERGGWLGIRAGEGLWWIPSHDCRSLGTSISLAAVLARFRRFVGVPYLWGGRTAWGWDCSGLAQALHAELGIALPRDTDQQLTGGVPVEGATEAGDLLFFGDPSSDDPGRVRHVAIELDGDRFLHAWGASGCVTVSSRRDEAARDLVRAFLGARRYVPSHDAI